MNIGVEDSARVERVFRYHICFFPLDARAADQLDRIKQRQIEHCVHGGDFFLGRVLVRRSGCFFDMEIILINIVRLQQGLGII